MKTSASFFLIIAIGLIFSSCKKEYSVENADIATANFTAVIGGVQWSATRASETATLALGMLNITGISSDGQEISITLTDTTLGVHNLSPTTSSLGVYGFIDSSYTTNFTTGQGTSTSQTGGQVTLTAIDQLTNTVSGTFAFNVYRPSDGATQTIASGVFSNIPYTTTLPGSSPSDTVTASIDGALFNSASIQALTAGGNLSITGNSSNGTQSISLIMPTNAPVGNHALSASYVAIYDFIGSNGNSTAAPATAGSINILGNNAGTSRIWGSFSFTTTDQSAGNSSHTVTSGYFSVYYGQ